MKSISLKHLQVDRAVVLKQLEEANNQLTRAKQQLIEAERQILLNSGALSYIEIKIKEIAPKEGEEK